MKRQILVSVLLAGGALSTPTFAALPYATSVSDLCPGLPMHCLVTAKWAVANGASFDMGGRILDLAPTAQLVGDSGASFSITNASQIILQKGSVISSIGRGVDAGTITFASTGSCSFSGQVLANAVVVNNIGGIGGTVFATCVGFSLDGGKIEAKGVRGSNGGLGFGGTVDLNAGTGTITTAKRTKVNASGKGSDGGFVALLAQGACALSGTLQANAKVVAGEGAAGGTIDVSCNGISWLAGSLKARGASGGITSGTGGSASIEAGTGTFVLAKPARIDVGTRGDDAGDVSISALGACTVNGKLNASTTGVVAGLGGGNGTIDFACNGITLGRTAALRARGVNGASPLSGGPGGDVTLNAGATGLTSITGAKIDVTCKGADAGEVSIISGAAAPCSVAMKIQADSKKRNGLAGAGGLVSMLCGGDILVAGKVQSRSPAGGGQIVLDGCTITVAATGTLDTSDLQGGQNHLTAHHDLDIGGYVLAVSLDTLNAPGVNDLKYRDTATVTPGRVLPASAPVQNMALPPC